MEKQSPIGKEIPSAGQERWSRNDTRREIFDFNNTLNTSVKSSLIAQNVHLAFASLGLAAWFHNCNKLALQITLALPPHPRPLFGQTIGYPED
jgi:hypothetical protein